MLLYTIANPEVVVKANRKNRAPIIRQIGSLLFNWECQCLFQLPWGDINGTPKIFPRKFDQLLSLSRSDDLIDLEFSIVCKKENYPVKQIPIFSTKRYSGQSSTTFKSALNLYGGALKYKFLNK